MTGGELNEVSRIIGGLQTAVETLTRTWQEQDRRAAEGRQRLYENFDELKTDVRDRLSSVEQSVKTLAADVAEMQPSVEDWRAMRLQAKGATFAAKGLGRAIYLVVAIALVAGGWALAHVNLLIK